MSCTVSHSLRLGHAVHVQELKALTRLTALTRLVFHEVTLYDDGLQNIAACCQLKQLALDLDRYPRTPASAAGIMQLTQLTRLTQLSINDVMKPGMVSWPAAFGLYKQVCSRAYEHVQPTGQSHWQLSLR